MTQNIIEKIKILIKENMSKYLPDISKENLEEDGTIYYMNGKNGTEFDWYVNEKISDFFVFYNDSENFGAVKMTVYCDGYTIIYIYDENGHHLKQEIETDIHISEEELFHFAVLLKNTMDEKLIWDKSIDQIDSDYQITAEQIHKFKENEKHYQGMIERKKMFGMSCYVSKRLLEEGWKVGFQKFIQVVSVVKSVQNLNILQISTRPEAFCSVICNENELLERFNIHLYPITLNDVVLKMQAIREENGEDFQKTLAFVCSLSDKNDPGKERIDHSADGTVHDRKHNRLRQSGKNRLHRAQFPVIQPSKNIFFQKRMDQNQRNKFRGQRSRSKGGNRFRTHRRRDRVHRHGQDSDAGQRIHQPPEYRILRGKRRHGIFFSAAFAVRLRFRN